MTLFDYMVSTKENNMLKAFIPYIDKDFQPMLATYIKYSELLATIDLFRKKGRNVFTSNHSSSNFNDIITALLPYVSDKEREMFETINNIKNTMEMFEMYKDMISPDLMSSFSNLRNMDNTTDCDNNNNHDNSELNFSSNNTAFTDANNNDISDYNNTNDTTANNNGDTPENKAMDNNMSGMLTSILPPEQQILFEQLAGMMNNT